MCVFILKFSTTLARFTESVSLIFCSKLPDPAVITELEQKLDELQSETKQLKEKLLSAEEEVKATTTRLNRAQMDIRSLEDTLQEKDESNTRLRDKLSRLEVGNVLSYNADSR